MSYPTRTDWPSSQTPEGRGSSQVWGARYAALGGKLAESREFEGNRAKPPGLPV